MNYNRPKLQTGASTDGKFKKQAGTMMVVLILDASFYMLI
jgi:hypothetical protein